MPCVFSELWEQIQSHSARSNRWRYILYSCSKVVDTPTICRVTIIAVVVVPDASTAGHAYG